MKTGHLAALCTVSALALVGPAYGQAVTPVDDTSSAERADLTGEIIVTARRRDESLQDVPQTVSAVTGATIEKLNLQNFKDIQAVVPGLTLSGGTSAADNAFTLRGASFNTLAQNSSPSVIFYVNEVAVEAGQLFQGMYDIGQIEVLRGPQGTLRGVSAPSGAITITTRRPSLTEVGGYVNLAGTLDGNINANAAVSVPIIDGVLAVRVAGLVDHDDFNGVRSVNNGTSPYSRTESGRISVLFEPTDSIRATVMYQLTKARYRSFQQVAGFANDYTFPFPASLFIPPLPAGGPVITPEQRLGVSEGALTSDKTFHLVTGQVDWRFAGQKLSYVGSYAKGDSVTRTPQDDKNVFLGFEGFQIIGPPSGQWIHTHELRLASEERIAGMFDYTVGAYLSRQRGATLGSVEPSNPFFPFSVFISSDSFKSETSFFASGTAHLGERTELTAGARHIRFSYRQQGPYDSVPLQGNSICIPGLAGVPGFSPAGCLLNVASQTPISENAWVWNASLSHRFNENVLVYATAGTSYRAPFSVLVTNALSGTNPDTGTPFISSSDLINKPAERSTGYEIGAKTNFLDNRIRLNVAGYYQKYKNNSFYLNNIPYYNVSQGNVALGSFTATADAVVWGIDVDAALQITPRWSLTAGFAWADGSVDNDDIPCRDSDFNGVPDQGTPLPAGFTANNVIVARCLSNRSISTQPEWSLTLQSEYFHPISDRVDGFIRGLFTYYPANPNDNNNIVIEDYGLLNLYAGIRSNDDAWEVSLFAKNLTNTSQVLSYGDIPPPTSINLGPLGAYDVPVNYRNITYTPRREFGLNVRYAFGSR